MMKYNRFFGLLLAGTAAAVAAACSSSSTDGSPSNLDGGPDVAANPVDGATVDAANPMDGAGHVDASSNDSGNQDSGDRCAAYNTCMSSNCDQAGGDFLATCAGFTDEQYACRLMHCGYAAAEKNGVHCKHAVGVDMCE